jgi:hypothetical protein
MAPRRKFRRRYPMRRKRFKRSYRRLSFRRGRKHTFNSKKRKQRLAYFMHRKACKRNSYISIMRPIQERNQIRVVQGTSFRTLTYADFTTANQLGHYKYDWALGSIMTTQDVSDMLNKYSTWELLTFCVTIKVVGFNNITKYSNGGQALTNYANFQGPTDTGNEHGLFVAFFTNGDDQDLAASYDPEDPGGTTESARKAALLMNYNYKRLQLNGKPISWKYYKPPGFQGVANRITTSWTAATTLDTAFNLPVYMQPHGMDICLFDRTQYVGSAVYADRLNFRVQWLCTATIRSTSNARLDY